MISFILKSYLDILLAVGIGSLLLFISGLFFIFGRTSKPPILGNGLDAIAGEDLIATQLDLARAYIETANAGLAKAILKQVLKQGNKSQQEEARHLLTLSCS